MGTGKAPRGGPVLKGARTVGAGGGPVNGYTNRSYTSYSSRSHPFTSGVGGLAVHNLFFLRRRYGQYHDVALGGTTAETLAARPLPPSLRPTPLLSSPTPSPSLRPTPLAAPALPPSPPLSLPSSRSSVALRLPSAADAAAAALAAPLPPPPPPPPSGGVDPPPWSRAPMSTRRGWSRAPGSGVDARDGG